jgi:hypothetical protein
METALRGWHIEHPPTAVDIQRNEDIFAYQNNRNPFVDYPQFADRIFSFRTEENRPNIGELVVSHTEADFGIVEGSPESFDVVVSNTGERFFSISNVSVSGNGFSLSADQQDPFNLLDGEASTIRVVFDPSLAQGVTDGFLTFETNLSASPEITIPLSAEGILSLSDVVDVDVKLYPNPAGEWFRITDSESRIQNVRLLDIQGREIQSYPAQETEYSVNEVGNGIYLVETIFENGERGIGRLVVNR